MNHISKRFGIRKKNYCRRIDSQREVIHFLPLKCLTATEIKKKWKKKSRSTQWTANVTGEALLPRHHHKTEANQWIKLIYSILSSDLCAADTKQYLLMNNRQNGKCLFIVNGPGKWFLFHFSFGCVQHPPIHPTNHPSIQPSIYLSIYPFTLHLQWPQTCPSTHSHWLLLWRFHSNYFAFTTMLQQSFAISIFGYATQMINDNCFFFILFLYVCVCAFHLFFFSAFVLCFYVKALISAIFSSSIFHPSYTRFYLITFFSPFSQSDNDCIIFKHPKRHISSEYGRRRKEKQLEN